MRYFKCLSYDNHNVMAAKAISYDVPHMRNGRLVPGNKTRKIRGKLAICQRGYHLAKEDSIIDWISTKVYEAVGFGDSVDGTGKIAFRQVQLIKEMKWNNRIMAIFILEAIMNIYWKYITKRVSASYRLTFAEIMKKVISLVDNWEVPSYETCREINKQFEELKMSIPSHYGIIKSIGIILSPMVEYYSGDEVRVWVPSLDNVVTLAAELEREGSFQEKLICKKKLNDRMLDYLDGMVNTNTVLKDMNGDINEEIRELQEEMR